MMSKKYLILVLLFLFYFSNNAQSFKNSILSKFYNNSELKVEKINEELIRITYPDGVQRIMSIAEREAIIPKGDIGYTYINLTEVDTLKYYWKFKHWQTLLFTEFSFNSIMAADVNGNGMIELYGIQYYDHEGHPTLILEKNSDGMFEHIYTYPDSLIHIRNIYDVDGDGELEVQMQDNAINGFLELFYEKPHPDSFATKLKFNYPVSSIYHPKLGNFDGDSFTDMVYLEPSEQIYFAEYNPIINNFEIVASFRDSLHPANNWLGFAVGDFDNDGFTEFVTGDVFGFVKIKENAGNNIYIETWEGAVNTHNAYTFAETKDIDGNGKPEFWIKGDLGVTKITIFEAAGNDQYEIVGEIDLDGAASWNASYMQAIDMDMDGVEEMLVAIDGYVIILRFVGRPDYQVYSLYYIKTLSGLRGAIGSHLGIRGYEKKPALLITYTYWNPYPNRIDYTNIYVASDDTVTSIMNEEPLSGFEVKQNYPNPFNPSTQIKYSLAQDADVTLKVYDMLGKEVAELVNETQTAGSYEIKFNAENLSSGVYVYRISATNNGRILFTDSKQMILLR